MKNKALFLDRDGIINVDKGYVYKWEDIEWFPEIFEIIKLANKHKFKVIVLTNQSGVERGMYSEAEVIKLHQQMHEFLLQNGCFVDDWFYCLNFDGLRRKPQPGMIYEACVKHEINISESIMIGDKLTDVFILKDSERLMTVLVQGNYDLTGASHKKTETLKICLNHQALIAYLDEQLIKS